MGKSDGYAQGYIDGVSEYANKFNELVEINTQLQNRCKQQLDTMMKMHQEIEIFIHGLTPEEITKLFQK